MIAVIDHPDGIARLTDYLSSNCSSETGDVTVVTLNAVVREAATTAGYRFAPTVWPTSATAHSRRRAAQAITATKRRLVRYRFAREAAKRFFVPLNAGYRGALRSLEGPTQAEFDILTKALTEIIDLAQDEQHYVVYGVTSAALAHASSVPSHEFVIL